MRRPLRLASAFAALTLLTAAGRAQPATDDWPRGRLDDTAVPLAYALELTVIPSDERFSGHADIVVDLREPTASIFLHGNGLDVDRATVTTAAGEVLAVDYRQLSDDGVAVVDVGRELAPQRIVLEFEYTAAFGQRLHGMYRVEEGVRQDGWSNAGNISRA